MINLGKFNEARLGVFAYDKDVLPYMNLKSNKGVYITKVTKNTTAEKAGIQKGDVILSIDENNLERMCELRCYIYTKKPNDEVTLKLLRNNREFEVKVKLDKK